MNVIGRIPFLAAMFFIPGLSFVVVAGSIYMQGLASPFIGIFLGIAGLFFGLKAVIWSLSVIDDLGLFVHHHWPAGAIGPLRASILKFTGGRSVGVLSRV
jgi:hypothetical protein